MVWSHYVPQFYIRRFGINEKQTARLDKKTGKLLEVSIESFCAEDDFFSFDSDSLINLPWYLRWIDKDLIERNLANFIEGPVDLIIKKIEAKESLEAVSENEMLMLLEWAAWLFIANPTSIALKSIKDLTDEFHNTEFSKHSNTDRLKIFCDLHQRVTPIFQMRGWVLQRIDSQHGLLMSSDRPVMLGGQSLAVAPSLQEHTIFIPLSPRLLLIGNNDSRWGYASQPFESRQEASTLVNILTYEKSYRFVFASSLEEIKGFWQKMLDNSLLF